MSKAVEESGTYEAICIALGEFLTSDPSELPALCQLEVPQICMLLECILALEDKAKRYIVHYLGELYLHHANSERVIFRRDQASVLLHAAFFHIIAAAEGLESLLALTVLNYFHVKHGIEVKSDSMSFEEVVREYPVETKEMLMALKDLAEQYSNKEVKAVLLDTLETAFDSLTKKLSSELQQKSAALIAVTSDLSLAKTELAAKDAEIERLKAELLAKAENDVYESSAHLRFT